MQCFCGNDFRCLVLEQMLPIYGPWFYFMCFQSEKWQLFCSSSQGMLAYTSVRKEEIPCCGVSWHQFWWQVFSDPWKTDKNKIATTMGNNVNLRATWLGTAVTAYIQCIITGLHHRKPENRKQWCTSGPALVLPPWFYPLLAVSSLVAACPTGLVG